MTPSEDPQRDVDRYAALLAKMNRDGAETVEIAFGATLDRGELERLIQVLSERRQYVGSPSAGVISRAFRGGKGYRWVEKSRKFTVAVSSGGVNFYGGVYAEEEDAKAAVVRLRRKLGLMSGERRAA